MSRREMKKDQAIEHISKKLYSVIRSMKEGAQDSIGHLVSLYYAGKGYEYHWLDEKHGHGWTKDDRKTFSVCMEDLFLILDKTSDLLKDEVELDFSKYEDMVVGLPFNLMFSVRPLRPDCGGISPEPLVESPQ